MRRTRLALASLAAVIPFGLQAKPARAADVNADPTNYAQVLATLAPGDTLHLAAGTYAPAGSTALMLTRLNGTPSQWITVTGPPTQPPTAIFRASPDGCCNVVEIKQSSYLALENLYIDGDHVNGPFGISANGGTSNLVHDVRIEGNTLVGFDNDGDPADLGQQEDGISTKTPTWGWIIRRNRIIGAGTGMYLGNSDGSDPFVAGIIDGNLIDRPTGYCIEIKQQNPWPTVAGMPTQPTATLISNNVFIKADHAATTSGGRPQVLVDGFPKTGAGSRDHYEIFGNFFFHDSDDFLLQATGRVHVHDNVFVDDPNGAIDFTSHDGFGVIDAIAYDNTIYGVATGIAFGSAPTGVSFVVGNAIFASNAFSGAVRGQTDDVVDTIADAGSYVASPSLTLGAMDFYPKTGSALRKSVMDLSSVAGDVDYDLDFNGVKKDFTFRGAYSGEGTNPGWPLGDGEKSGGPGDGDAGVAGSAGDGGDEGGAAGNDIDDSGSDAASLKDAPARSSGCACAAARARRGGVAFGIPFGVLALAWALRRRTTRARTLHPSGNGMYEDRLLDAITDLAGTLSSQEEWDLPASHGFIALAVALDAGLPHDSAHSVRLRALAPRLAKLRRADRTEQRDAVGLVLQWLAEDVAPIVAGTLRGQDRERIHEALASIDYALLKWDVAEPAQRTAAHAIARIGRSLARGGDATVLDSAVAFLSRAVE